MIDQYFTSDTLSDQLASFVPRFRGVRVFDPAVGDGALLRAVSRRLPTAKLFGVDIDPAVVARVSTRNPSWELSVGDSLSVTGRAASSSWVSVARDGVDCVVVNPPFSFRGGGGVALELSGLAIKVGPAAAFLYIALQELSPRFGAIAILPSGSSHNLRDAAVWNDLAPKWSRRVVASLPRGAFAEVSASCELVVFESRVGGEFEEKKLSLSPIKLGDGECACVDVVRGRVPVSRHVPSLDQGASWLHTTCLQDQIATPVGSQLNRSLNTVGPFVVVPRVGRFHPSKIALYEGIDAVLSDCVFAIRPRSVSLEKLQGWLTDNSDGLASLYVGTGAPHLTLGRLLSFLQAGGLEGSHTSAGAPPSSCRCPRGSR